MKPYQKLKLTFFLVPIWLVTFCNLSHGALIMTLTATPGSNIVQFELSGTESISMFSGIIVGIAASGLQDYDALGGGLGTQDMNFSILSGSATVTNLSNNDVGTVESIFLRDVTSGDRFGVLSSAYRIDAGHSISWAGSGSIDLGEFGGSIDDLTLGEGESLLTFPEPEGTGILVIKQVPESSTLIGIFLGALVISFRRSRSLIRCVK